MVKNSIPSGPHVGLFTAPAHIFVSDSAYESLGRLRLGLTDQAPLG